MYAVIYIILIAYTVGLIYCIVTSKKEVRRGSTIEGETKG